VTSELALSSYQKHGGSEKRLESKSLALVLSGGRHDGLRRAEDSKVLAADKAKFLNRSVEQGLRARATSTIIDALPPGPCGKASTLDS
jgi:hypothetical protein